jgi:hypothetical protein
MSLKTILFETLKSSGTLNLNDIEAICHLNNKKISNGERRLRELMAKDLVEPVMKNGAIIAYKYKSELLPSTLELKKIMADHLVDKSKKEAQNKLF